MVYDPYIRAITELASVASGKKEIDSSASFGVLIKTLPNKLSKLGINGLVDPDAGWLRNATSHGSWNFIPEIGKIELKDFNTPSKQFEVDEFFNKAVALYETVYYCYLHYYQFYLHNKVYNNWLPILKIGQENFDQIMKNDGSFSRLIDKLTAREFTPVTELTFKRQGEKTFSNTSYFKV
jgi:hypothetical protein